MSDFRNRKGRLSSPKGYPRNHTVHPENQMVTTAAPYGLMVRAYRQQHDEGLTFEIEISGCDTPESIMLLANALKGLPEILLDNNIDEHMNKVVSFHE